MGDLENKILNVPPLWKELIIKNKSLEQLIDKDFLVNEYQTKTIYPKIDNIYNALSLTPPNSVKLVILGQDPYIREGQAHGLAFSVPKGTIFPPSLKNIFKELKIEFSYPIPKSGDLTFLAKQGVLLLNTALTVEEGKKLSHKEVWVNFTDEIIKIVSSFNRPIVFLLMGNEAYKKADLIHNKNHLIIHTAHPSPLSANRGFFYSFCFQKCEEFFLKHNESPIDFNGNNY